MKRRSLLIAACTFAAVSVGLNVWLLMLRKKRSVEPGPATQTTPHDASVGPVLQPVTMDFSDTAFADGSWKLTDDADSLVSLDKPFKWEDVTPEGLKIDLTPRPFRPPRFGTISALPKPEEHMPYDAAESNSTGGWHPPWKAIPIPLNLRQIRKVEVPEYLDQPMDDPNNVRNKALITYPPPHR